jgi:MoaA/NifB/PqqE/SkfB family radical SAM enzyme
MHLPPDLAFADTEPGHAATAPAQERRPLEFLWLELTNRCNLQCVHCYTESHPHSGDRDLLATRDYESIMNQAYALGCRKIQFIGGEPQLNRDFLPLLITAKAIGFEFIEVYSNLTRLADETVAFAAENGVCFATSVYSDEPSVHDAITTVRSSHARTIKNLKKLISNGIETRAAIIVINQGTEAVDQTRRFLEDFGVSHVRDSKVREFGRGEDVLGQRARMAGLCGHCWAGKLCVAPDGAAYPCVMARQWPIGNVLEAPLAEIVGGEPLQEIRQEIFETVWLPKIRSECAPLTPGTCPPEGCPQDCSPMQVCSPHINCPQSCVPKFVCSPAIPQ